MYMEEAAYPEPVSPLLPAARQSGYFDLWLAEHPEALLFPDFPED